ncbi:hypothetical protein MMC24_001529 [Lignoscripta atroalba]|nr:hypothetical protein [Lignoscripta atroalba]
MPEVVLPTGAVIAAFTMAVISWYGMLRTGMQLIHSDIKESKSYKVDVKMMVDELGFQTRKLEKWKKQWVVWSEAPESLHFVLWGETEYDTIKIKLEGMYYWCKEAGKDLHQFANLTETSWRALNAAKRKYLKVKFISVKRKYLQELLENMTKGLNKLDEAAKNGWQRDQEYKGSEVDFAQVQHKAIGHLLVPIAMRSQMYTDIIWQSCTFARETLTTELDLDIFGASAISSRERYLEIIAKAGAEQQATLTILTRAATLNMAEMTRIGIKESASSTQDHATALVDALNRIIGGTEECHFVAGPNRIYHVFKSRGHVHGPGTGMRETLRQIQSKNDPPDFRNEGLLGTISKFRMAFELAQACLLFLPTTWFSNICSCRIRCGQFSHVREELRYDFSLQLGAAEHECPQWANIPQNCWAQTQYNWNILTTPVRRLGLLLIEATLGTTVLKVQCAPNGAVTSISFVEGQPGNLRKKTHSLDYVLESVRFAARRSTLYEKAVKHCLTTVLPQFARDAQMEEILANFYWDVVVP